MTEKEFGNMLEIFSFFEKINIHIDESKNRMRIFAAPVIYGRCYFMFGEIRFLTLPNNGGKGLAGKPVVVPDWRCLIDYDCNINAYFDII